MTRGSTPAPAGPAATAGAGTDPLRIAGLKVNYGRIQAVKGIDLTVGRSEVVTLLGANGAGKSSTLNAVMGAVPGRSGSVRVAGEETIHMVPERIARTGVAIVPEGRRLFPNLTVRENIMLGGTVRDGATEMAADFDRVVELFPILAERAGSLAGHLSGGQQQQVAIARALMSKPEILLLDEPSLGLAPKVVAQVFAALTELKATGLTMVVVEQNAARALELADRAYVLAHGRVVIEGEADELRDSPSETLTAAYLGGAAPPAEAGG